MAIHPCLTYPSRTALYRMTVDRLMSWSGRKTERVQTVLLVMKTLRILIYYRHYISYDNILLSFK
jgi:hypothetical protein